MKNTSFERLAKHQHDEHGRADKVLFFVAVVSGISAGLIIGALLIWFAHLLANL